MPRHVVVDGSNIGTEGRAMPSLRQLNEAVMAFLAEFPDDKVTVVVDATFGHRIDPSEVAEFNAAIENNELVSPPAGAVGRGDAFVLAIAKKVGAAILSNDSYQEFHGEHAWVFDEGRLLGGKPVPHVGWVFVARTPVRGPISRRAVKSRKGRDGREPKQPRPTAAASQPMPVPKAPPPRSSRATKEAKEPAAASATAASAKAAAKQPAARVDPAQAPTQGRGSFVNESLPFLTFVGAHPVGAEVSGTVESYSSHGAYVMVDDTRCYVPLRFMAVPAPRAARDVLKLGQPYTFIVVSFNAGRRSVDLAVPGHAPAGVVPLVTPTKRRGKRAAAAEPVAAPAVEAVPAGRRAKKAAPISPAAEPEPTPSKRRKAAAATAPTAPTAEVETSPAPATRRAKKAAAAGEPAARRRRGAAKATAAADDAPAAGTSPPAEPPPPAETPPSAETPPLPKARATKAAATTGVAMPAKATKARKAAKRVAASPDAPAEAPGKRTARGRTGKAVTAPPAAT